MAAWEFKSLTVGSNSVMGKIKDFTTGAANFEWIRCSGPEECRKGNHYQEFDVTRRMPRGFDARNPPWKLPSSDEGMEDLTSDEEMDVEGKGKETGEGQETETDMGKRKGAARRGKKDDEDETSFIKLARSFLQQVCTYSILADAF
jgi:hypothetical protein